MNGIGVVLLLLFALAFSVWMLRNESERYVSGRREAREAWARRIGSCILVLAISMAGSWTFQRQAGAELMWGEVETVYPVQRALKIRKFVPQTMEFEETRIEVPGGADLEEMASIEELETGDKVLIDAERNRSTGKWVASFVDLSEKGS